MATILSNVPSTSAVDPSMVRRPRACIPCHERKVKCNASHTGLPCTRCHQQGRVAACELVPLPDRSSARLKTRKRQASDSHMEQGQRELPVPAIFDLSSSRADRRSENTHQRPPTAIYNPASQDSLSGFFSEGRDSPSFARCNTPAPNESFTDCKVRDRETNRVAEEDSQLESCLRLAQTEDYRSDLTSGTSTLLGREVFAYHGGIDSTTILGQVLSKQNPRRFVRILLREPHHVEDGSTSYLNAKATEHLQNVGALDIPSSPTCQKLVQLYFERVFPYVPVLNRLSFMKELSEGKCSIFLLQCIFTSVAPYMCTELLSESGYSDRPQAQRALFSKAQLLYDLGAERSQLRLLQGSLVLTTSYFAFGLDKDCRYWLSNAVRIATQMGLHRKQLADQLGRDTRKLFARIFWVMYSRDIIMVMAGRINVRALDDRYCDVPEVNQEDWEDEAENQLASYGLCPISALQKSYLVHSSRLARTCAQYVEVFRRPDVRPTRAACEDIEKRLLHWRRALSPELQSETVDSWSQENVWILVLRAMGYRLESLLYRDIRELPRLEQDAFGRRALQKQQNAMLELDSIIHRIMLHDLVGFCPFSMTTCASTMIAMHIECALSPSSTPAQRRLSQTSIHSGLAYLRASLQHWDSVRWSLRMFDAIVSKSRLSLTALEHHRTDLPSVHSCPLETTTAVNRTTDAENLSGTAQEPTVLPLISEESDPAWTSLPTNSTFSVTNPNFPFEAITLDSGQEGDFNEIFIEDLFSVRSLPPWAYGAWNLPPSHL